MSVHSALMLASYTQCFQLLKKKSQRLVDIIFVVYILFFKAVSGPKSWPCFMWIKASKTKVNKILIQPGWYTSVA